MTAFIDDDADHLTRARDAYYVATGRPLDPHDAAIRWALDALSVPQVDRSQRRAVEMMAPWLDGVVGDPETRARLGLVVYPAWIMLGTYRGPVLLLESNTIPAAYVDDAGWTAYRVSEGERIGDGLATGPAGMDAAERALIAAGVLPAGCTPRRPVML